MSTTFIPPRRSYHLRVFAICLALVVIALLSFLFGVQLDAIRPAMGTVQSQNRLELRAPIDGLVRLNSETVTKGGTTEARPPKIKKLRIGDLVRGGDIVATVEREALRPPAEGHWLVVSVAAAHLQPVRAGDLLVSLVPADPSTSKPSELIADLEIAESQAGDVAAGQRVRLYSTMFNQRLHGHADGRIESVAPMAHLADDGERKFRATAAIISSPFPLHLGSSLRAEILVGKKQVYKIILEQ